MLNDIIIKINHNYSFLNKTSWINLVKKIK